MSAAVVALPTGTVSYRHPVHWDQRRGDYFFAVGTTLYKLDSVVLIRHSALLRNMFGIPSGEGHSDGLSEETPIPLPTMISEPEFDIFVSQAYGKYVPQTTNTVLLINILKLSNYLISSTLRDYAIHAIETCRFNFDPCDLIALCIQYNTKQFFNCAFNRLVNTRPSSLTAEKLQKIPYSVYIAISQLRDVLDEHCRIVAAEPPTIHTHCSDCQNTQRCADDWHTTWWNGMARMLLDGRNPLTFEDSFKRFETMEFGEMTEGCKTAMLQAVRDGDAFVKDWFYMQEYTKSVADALIVEDTNDDFEL